MEQNSITVTYIFSGNLVGNFLSGEIMASRKATIWGPLLLSEKVSSMSRSARLMRPQILRVFHIFLQGNHMSLAAPYPPNIKEYCCKQWHYPRPFLLSFPSCYISVWSGGSIYCVCLNALQSSGAFTLQYRTYDLERLSAEYRELIKVSLHQGTE